MHNGTTTRKVQNDFAKQHRLLSSCIKVIGSQMSAEQSTVPPEA